ncbi:MAG: hypothetical protein D6732_18120 [Methanobacteriota archaeon]|nr:MAG: hypothetical protein D6732_18120 [Euryarchaeota archaeon]
MNAQYFANWQVFLSGLVTLTIAIAFVGGIILVGIGLHNLKNVQDQQSGPAEGLKKMFWGGVFMTLSSAVDVLSSTFAGSSFTGSPIWHNNPGPTPMAQFILLSMMVTGFFFIVGGLRTWYQASLRVNQGQGRFTFGSGLVMIVSGVAMGHPASTLNFISWLLPTNSGLNAIKAALGL